LAKKSAKMKLFIFCYFSANLDRKIVGAELEFWLSLVIDNYLDIFR